MENILNAHAAGAHTLVASLSNIPAGDLAIAIAVAQLDPDGQVFPWRPMYPLVGGTVVYDGQLWTVARKERGIETAISVVRLIGQGHDGEAIATRGDLRPVLWTSEQEGEYQRAIRTEHATLQLIPIFPVA